MSISLRFLTWTLTYDTGTSSIWKTYIDGILVLTTSGYYPSTSITLTKNYIGKSNWGSDPYYNGTVDDFRVYNRVITASEVLILYDNK